MTEIYLLNKPYHVLCQFRDTEGRQTLANFINIPEVYAAGRLDFDSEGLLLLTSDGAVQHAISSPTAKQRKSYWVQVEGDIDEQALQSLQNGVQLKDGPTLPATAEKIAEPNIWPRNPPIRERASIPTSWINLSITEGRNRQVRRMTAAVGYPTLRLIRHQIAEWSLKDLLPGEWRKETADIPLTRKKANVKHSGRSKYSNSNRTRNRHTTGKKGLKK